MEGKEYAKLLQEINTEVNEVVWALEREENETYKIAIITEFANATFQKGFNFGLSKE